MLRIGVVLVVGIVEVVVVSENKLNKELISRRICEAYHNRRHTGNRQRVRIRYIPLRSPRLAFVFGSDPLVNIGFGGFGLFCEGGFPVLTF